MMLMAAADEVELMHMVATQALYDEGPSACVIRVAKLSDWLARARHAAGNWQGPRHP